MILGQSEMTLTGRSGEVTFISEAPLEFIQANSTSLEGVLIPENGRFAFQVEIISFEGFNNPLQRIHFQENYLESHHFPKATFEGKILDEDILEKVGKHEVRTKGILTIHGIERERIIKGSIDIQENKTIITAEFAVALEDHNIRIPRIVYQKIAEEIQVTLRIELE